MSTATKVAFLLLFSIVIFQNTVQNQKIDIVNDKIDKIKIDTSLSEEFESIYNLFIHQNSGMYEMLDQQQVVLHHTSGHGPTYRTKNCKICAIGKTFAADGFRLENRFRDASPLLISKDGKIRVVLRGTDMDSVEEVAEAIKEQKLKLQKEE